MWNEVKTQPWESTAGEALQAWLPPFSPDNGVSSWFKLAPAVHTHSSRMQSSFMFVFICLSKLLLFKVCDFHQQTPVDLLSCSVDLQNVFRTSWSLINLSGALWPVQRWLLIRFNSWLISLNWGLIGCLSNPPGLAEINRQHDFGALMDADAGAGTLVRVLTQQIPQ